MNRFKELESVMKEKLSCSAHNIDHVNRVLGICKIIGEEYKEVDRNILLTAALLHDIARTEEDEDKSGAVDHATLGAELAGKLLADFGYPQPMTEQIKHCIACHRYRSDNEPVSLEAKILFDADKIDALGAVGVARAFMIAGRFGERLHADNFDGYTDNITSNGRLKDISKHAPNIEYNMKMKRLPQRMYTDSGRLMAEERLKFMEKFFGRLEDELAGKF